MLNSLPLFVGLRYVRARSHKFFVSFITWVSLLCVCLGVTALIVILSVMNGLEGELRERLLALSAHARIFVPANSTSAPPDWQALAGQVRTAPNVTGASPFIEIEALAMRKPDMLPVRLRGIDPTHEGDVEKLSGAIIEGKLADLEPGSDRVLVGRSFAQMLGIGIGDSITVLIPTTDADGAPQPRLREFQVVGVLAAELQDTEALLITSLADVRALLPDPDSRMSLHVNFREPLGAPEYAKQLAKQLPAGVEIRDWTFDHASYFRAIRIEKTMVAIILMLIVAVAAFYLVAMLAMVVTDKRTDIAILRTLGASPRRVMTIFLIQGSVIAWFGVALGVLLGTLIGYHAGAVAAFLERLFRFEIFDSTVYVVTRLPSELRAQQILWIAGVAMFITLLATIYPSLRAARIPPADALRYE
jgi:lipoprotein-releasing system permease protein